MKQYILKLELISPALIGSGEGFGAIIDTDIVFDEVGIPYIPAKRIKGCLRDSAMEIREMLNSSGISFPVETEKAFGKPGDSKSAPVYFSNLTIDNYEDNKKCLEYFLKSGEYNDILSRERILETFTETRQQTRIGLDGVAYDHSLRTIRVIKKDTTFYGDIFIEEKDDEDIINTLLFGCLNFCHIGTKRNRGFGEVRCILLDKSGTEIPIQDKLEKICT
ncbi:MAG TPA: hypothetical protein ENG83_07470 [Nitrospirae bacterium]|nr:RAMP superfamily protein [bacterium BMS3Abin06]HDH12019.1 hypothetical protein [Nitrospirota bacterium]HDZ00839.1 hypothetical protein [Nitrospirota bacterium]